MSTIGIANRTAHFQVHTGTKLSQLKQVSTMERGPLLLYNPNAPLLSHV